MYCVLRLHPSPHRPLSQSRYGRLYQLHWPLPKQRTEVLLGRSSYRSILGTGREP